MGFDSTILSDKSASDIIEADDLRLRFDHIKNEINGGLTSADVSDNSIETQHIFKPEFYGAPSPHIIGVSSDTYYRRRSGNKLDRYYRHESIGSKVMEQLDLTELKKNDHSAWQPIEGLSATVYVDSETTPMCSVMGNFYAFESGGKAGKARKHILFEGRDTGIGNEKESISGWQRATAAGQLIAGFCVFVDYMDGNGPQQRLGTFQRLFATGGGRYRMRRQNHSFCTHISRLTPGENKISVRCIYRQKSFDDITMRHLYIDARNLVVDILYPEQ